MCYHVSQEKDKEDIKKAFKKEIKEPEKFEQAYHFNGFEKPFLPVISNADPEFINMYRWKLVPGYIEDERTFSANTLNARAEDIFTKSSYKKYWSNRALIICSGFFEPHYAPGEKKAQSYYIKPKEGDFFTVGAIFSLWKGIYTFSIVTVKASPKMAEVHNDGERMPLLLTGERAEQWLRKDLTQEEMSGLMVPYPNDDYLVAYRVMDGVTASNVNTNIPEVLLPYQQKEGPLSLF